MISDEIHCDLTEPGYGYTPFASVSEECAQNSITCIAPTKAFNLAGLQTAAVAVPNEYLRHKMERALNSDEVAEPNAFAIDAAIAAFTQGEEWLDDLRNYLAENRRIVSAFWNGNCPMFLLCSPTQRICSGWTANECLGTRRSCAVISAGKRAFICRPAPHTAGMETSFSV